MNLIGQIILYVCLCKEGVRYGSNSLFAGATFPLPSLTGVPQTGTKQPQLDTATQFAAIDSLLNLQTCENIQFEVKNSKFISVKFFILFTFQTPSAESRVEVLVQESPSFLVHSFMELMPELPELTDNKLSVVCVSEHTIQDMSMWSQEMSQEREELTLNVVPVPIRYTLQGQKYLNKFVP